jgi:SMC interacting uncharacterized protein involved in chromosome segregation
MQSFLDSEFNIPIAKQATPTVSMPVESFESLEDLKQKLAQVEEGRIVDREKIESQQREIERLRRDLKNTTHRETYHRRRNAPDVSHSSCEKREEDLKSQIVEQESEIKALTEKLNGVTESLTWTESLLNDDTEVEEKKGRVATQRSKYWSLFH